jgi:hypothetical protein
MAASARQDQVSTISAVRKQREVVQRLAESEIKPCNVVLGVLLRVTGRTLGDQTFPSSGDRYRDG